jgi:8-oxo-dGTP diphosphatase
MHEHIGVAIIVLDKTKRKILLGKRKNAYKAGLYGLPGGRIELKESFEQTVRRELKEETNLNAQQITYLGVVRELQITYNFIHFVFLCESYIGEVVNQEPEKCEGWKWFKVDKIPEKTLPGHLSAIDLFKNPTNSFRELV